LTKNEMTVRYLLVLGQTPEDEVPIQDHFAAVSSLESKEQRGKNPHALSVQIEVTGEGYDPAAGTIKKPENYSCDDIIRLLMAGTALCSNARLVHLTKSSR
jgi:Ca2+-transporting ATPase